MKVTSAPNAMAAALAARRQGTRVEIAADRTSFSQTFANPNGTSTYEASAAPRWVKRGSSWVMPDASLVKGSDGSLSPVAAVGGLRLSGGGDRMLATLSSGGHSLSLSWPSVLPAPTVSGASARYPNVFPGVDLVVTASASGGFDETLVVRNQTAAADPQLSGLTLGVSASSGLSQHAGSDGAAVWGTSDGTPVFSSPPPLAWDSASAGSAVAGPGTGADVAGAGASYGKGTVRLGIPARLLSGPASRFPVYIDPSYSVTSTELTHDMVYSVFPNSSNWSTTQMGVGYTGSGIERSYYRMSIPSQLYGSTILSATFTDTVTNAQTSTSTSHTVTLHSSGAIDTSTTWSNQPGWGTNPPPVSTTFTTASTTPNKALSWDATQRVQTAADNQWTNWTVVLTNASETNSAVWVAFSATPTISITYDHAPAAPTDMWVLPQYTSPNGSVYTYSATPQFSAITTDADGDAVQYQMQVLSGSTVVDSGTTSSTPMGTYGFWTDTVALTSGSTYTFQARAYDGTEWGGWSAESFTVDTGTPPPPSVSCVDYPANTWTAPVAGGTTCSWNAALAAGYNVSLDGAAPTWTTATSAPFDPGIGMHTLTVTAQSAAGVWGSPTSYVFDVGATGAMMSPADGSQTSSAVTLQAAAPPGYTSASFYYRQGTTGSFQQIPDHVVFQCGCPVTWPVSTSSNDAGVQTDQLTWYVTRTLADDGPVQIEAVFTDGSGNSDTTPPVTVTLNRIGTGADYGTTTAGPVSVGLQSGNAAVTATDVNIASYGSGLAVTRTFNSVEPDKPSIFGWGWTTSLTGGVTTAWTQLTQSGSYVVLQAADGSNETFTQGSTVGGITSWTPQGDAVTSGLTLTQNTSGNTFTLTDSSGTVTVFGQANSAAGYVPQTVTVPGDSSSAGFVYDGNTTSGTYGDPLLMVAPDAASAQPSTTACPYPASASTWTAGCRGLQFVYNSGLDVSQISFVYVDNSGGFHSVPVADYGYDAAGKLTSEWDPRLATPLVTGYTYDETAADADYGRITQVSPAQASGSGALAPWTLTYDDTSGDVNYGHLLTVSRVHSAAYGGGTAATTIDYSVPLTTADGGPVDMDAATAGTWGQSDAPASAVAVFPPNHVPSSPPTATDYQYAQIDYYDASGREVNTASYINGAWAVTTTQYDAYGKAVSTLSAADRATALASSSPAATAWQLSAINIYGCDNFGTVGACTSSDQQYQVLTDSYGPAHNANVDGTVELIRTHTAYSYDAGAPNFDTSAGGTPYMLTTSQTESASVGSGVPGNATADAQSTTYTYGNASTNIGWTLSQPLTTVTDPSGLNLVSTSVFNTSSSLYNGANLQTGSYKPSNTGGGGAGDTETVYYTAGTNPVVAGCGNKPAWANLTCQTGPAAQPGIAGLPDLPVTTYTYDDYLNLVTKTETYGSNGARTTTTSYDAAERPSTKTVAVIGTGMGAAIPETKTIYSANSGLPTDTQTLDTNNNVTADINSTYDDFGNTLTYTDASGNITSYTYDIASRAASRNDNKGTRTYAYSPGGQLTTETDSQAGTFSATYNPDAKVATESYPGNLTGTYTYDATGTATALSYTGQSWTAPLTDTVVPNAAGDWLTRSITDAATPLVSSQAYSYDNAGRLTTVQDTQAGQCTTRAYGYDADSNRTSLTSYAPGTGGACQASSGTTATWAYDSADRLTNTGYTYDTQGDIATTPSADAGGTGNLTATYYANNMLSTQTQAGVTRSWTLDPGMNRNATWTDSSTGVTYTYHYADSSSHPAWSAGSDGSWTRYVTGPDNQLAAQVSADGTVLELPDLNNSIMATATTNPAATGPSSTYTYAEYGSPEQGTPGGYGWDGADQSSTSALGGDYITNQRAYSAMDGIYAQPSNGAYAFSNPPLGDPCRTISWTSWAHNSWGWRLLGFQLDTYYCWNRTKITYTSSWTIHYITANATGWSYNGASTWGHCLEYYNVWCGGATQGAQGSFVDCWGTAWVSVCIDHWDPIIYMYEFARSPFGAGFWDIIADGRVVQIGA